MIRAISHKYWLLFCLAHWGYPSLWATVQPADGSRLSQVHVMFEWDEVPLADGYELAVYQHVTRDGQTQSQKVIHVKTTAIACLATRGLAFGGAYHWRVKAFKKNQLVFESPDYGFDILTCARVMGDSFKTEISHRGKAGKGIVLLDRSAMAIDKAGKPVWFLPMPNDSVDRWLLRDLELTAFGTITYLDAHGAYEKDLMGRLLWRAPDDGKVSGGGQEAYHHEMAKADDGTYLLAGSAYMGNGLDAAQGILYNTIIRYDTLGGVRWYWDERSSLRQDSFFAQKNRYAKGSHLNGFALAKNGQQLYMSFKNLSDVLVYDRAKAGFVSSLKQRADGPSVAFRQQHGPFINKAQEILIYNNNIADDVEGVVHPTVMIFRQDPRNGRHRLVWEYPVRSSRYPEGIRGKEGYVSETADGTLLICPGGVNYALEVDRQKQKRWECYFHRRSGKDTVWQPYSNYRCQSATSLYPFYVTLQCVGIRKGAALFRLQNLGSEPAAFNLLFSGMASPPIRQVLPGRLMPGQAHWVRLPIGFCQKGDFSCTIQPRHGWMPSKTYFYKKME